MLLIQGLDDEYGTVAQIEVITARAKTPVKSIMLANCKHSPQRDQTQATLHAVARFVSQF